MSAREDVRHAYTVLKYIADQRAHLADMETEAKAVIQEFMGEQESLVLDGRQVITWKTRSSSRFQGREFKAAHPELHAEFTKTSEQRYFQLTED